jgi:predicted deacetylase
MPDLKLLFSLHDVTPFHRARIERAEALFARWGITNAAYLFIPNYHGGHLAQTAEFAAWCRRPRPFNVEWLLHGCYHLKCSTPRAPHEVQSEAELQGQGGEAEFADLDDAAADARLTHGRRIFEDCLGYEPRGFVPPVWSFRSPLLAQLQARQFAWTESRSAIYDLTTGAVRRSPAITWATRTVARKLTSLVGVPLLRLLWSRTPVLRIAVHPFDFDHPATIRSIERTIVRAVRARRQSNYADLFAPLV